MTVNVPSPLALKIKPASGSKAAASGPAPIGTWATTLPLAASLIAIILLLQTETRRWCATSIARPEGSSQSARGNAE